jgi:hypothetical protein
MLFMAFDFHKGLITTVAWAACFASLCILSCSPTLEFPWPALFNPQEVLDGQLLLAGPARRVRGPWKTTCIMARTC